ncbi:MULTISPECIES: MarR family winged helix-turn-helix transcriptional regulator [Rufibacter]|uniref:DNA-binding MarR family transcriptional regulator n=1 Tax=Rufibacter quisquiliarum TaxID=1549639 RepID=A0A839GN86_9BACT|nr:MULTISPECIES: MarR family transcriptional regulator [Rufibacter]MBA9076387.1 DNA-binding MarR family transcriptional regulator [Rufibacter quisquiliarum]
MKEASHIGLLIARTGLVLGKAVEKEFEAVGLDLTYQHFMFLNLLSKGNKLIQQDLADIVKIDKSAVLRVIAALEEKKLVERFGHTCDRRKKTLHLTTLGKTLLKKALLIEHKVNSTLQEGLTKEEVNVFIKVALHFRNKI